MATEVEEFLEHHGVLGMHWGKHKTEPTSVTPAKANPSGSTGVTAKKGLFNSPTVAKAVILGSYGKKSSYTSAAALQERRTAGKLRIAAILGSVGSVALSAAAAKGPMKTGIAVTSTIVSTAAGGVGLASWITGIKATNQEQQYRQAHA